MKLLINVPDGTIALAVVANYRAKNGWALGTMTADLEDIQAMTVREDSDDQTG